MAAAGTAAAGAAAAEAAAAGTPAAGTPGLTGGGGSAMMDDWIAFRADV